MNYIYRHSEPGLWTVGFYDPSGNWQPESDHDNLESAADRIHFLNGGSPVVDVTKDVTVAEVMAATYRKFLAKYPQQLMDTERDRFIFDLGFTQGFLYENSRMRTSVDDMKTSIDKIKSAYDTAVDGIKKIMEE